MLTNANPSMTEKEVNDAAYALFVQDPENKRVEAARREKEAAIAESFIRSKMMIS